jgi:putative molybdopterin biosynthesis protein
VSPPGRAGRPVPGAAYAHWLDSLARAGWSRQADRPQARSGAERLGLDAALGRVTAAPVTARWPSPRAACAAMDGIAVRAAALAAAPAAVSDNGGPADPGARDTVRLSPGQFAWIDTGDPMPAGADTVVIRERLLQQADGAVLVTPDARSQGDERLAAGRRPGANVRATGEDFATGELLVPAGRRLRPGDLATAAAGGHATVTVTRRPVVAIIPTGDEIRPPGSALRHGEITDSNSVMLAARCRQLEADPRVAAIVRDDPDALAVKLRRAAAQADLVLVIAGSSRGRDDHAGAVIAQVGGVAVAGVAVRPGHPALLGHAKRPDGPPGQRSGAAPVIGLPGYPLAAAVVFELFAVPLLSELTGREPVLDRVRARLDQSWCARADTEDWVLVTFGPEGGDGIPAATPARRKASALSQLAQADAWWRIPAGGGTFAAGEEIEVDLIR